MFVYTFMVVYTFMFVSTFMFMYNNTKNGLVSHVQAMDKAQESIVVAALTRFLSHCQAHV